MVQLFACKTNYKRISIKLNQISIFIIFYLSVRLCIHLGDFNICFLQTFCSLFKEYFGILNLFSLDQMITVPTRICSTSASILDHFLCNNKKKISKSGDIPVCLSDHFMTFCTRKLIRIKSSLPKTLKIRSLKNNCKETFVNKLLLADWNPCFLFNDINSAWVSFKHIFNCILDEVAPV